MTYRENLQYGLQMSELFHVCMEIAHERDDLHEWFVEREIEDYGQDDITTEAEGLL